MFLIYKIKNSLNFLLNFSTVKKTFPVKFRFASAADNISDKSRKAEKRSSINSRCLWHLHLAIVVFHVYPTEGKHCGTFSNFTLAKHTVATTNSY